MLTPRPSSMDRALTCPASLYPSEGEPLIEVIGDDAAPIGQAAHEVFKAVAMAQEYNIEEIAIKHGIKVSDLEYLRYTAYQSVEVLNEHFDVEAWKAEEKQISLPIKGLDILLSGTPDLSGVTKDGKTLIVVDYKTGRSTASHINQIKSYAHILLSQYEVEKVIGVIAWARDLEFQIWTWTQADLDAWVREANETIYGWDGVSYTVGEHCTFCRRGSSCKARALELKAGYELLSVGGGNMALDTLSLATAYEASKAIPKLIEDWRNRLKEKVKIEGDLDLGNGRVLTLKERNAPAKIDTHKAASILTDDFGFEITDIYDCCKIGTTDLKNKVGDKAAPRCKGKDQKAVIEALKEAGALTQEKVFALTVVDATKQLTEGEEA